MSIVFAILIFSVLIFIHEFGHFAAAKLSGVQVNEFAIFMGPAIFKKQVGETLYSIRCIPIGGYCAMEGEDEETENPRSFKSAAWWKRLIILVAGSAMNLIAGLLIMVAVSLPLQQILVPVIDSFANYATVNGENGLREGDRIIELDGEKVYVRADLDILFALNPADTHDLVVERNGQRVKFDDFKMEKHDVIDENGQIRQLYGMNFTVLDSPTLTDKLSYAWNYSIDTVRNVRLSLQMLLTGKAGINDVGGFVMIVDQMAEVADESETVGTAVMGMLAFGGMIALNLGVMNLLPIPALDGGRVVGLLLTTAVESVTKKKINPKYEAFLHGVGMVLLLILMAVIMFKDIFVIFKR